MLKNPLHEMPREQRAAIIRSKHELSLVDWLEASGRMVARESQTIEYLEEEDPEISGLIDVDDVVYDLDDDDELSLED